jgi:peptide/nickel transport system permease protein
MPELPLLPDRLDQPAASGAPRALRSTGGVLVLLLVIVAVAAPVLAPYDPARQIDPPAARYRAPGTTLALVESTDGSALLADRVERVPGGLRIERLGVPRVLPADEVANLTADGVADHRRFLLGTDGYGRDVLSRMIYGARISLLVGSLSVALALTLGLAIGSSAATGPRWLDAVLMRGVDAFLSFPRLFLVLTLTVLLPPSTALVVVVLGVTSWMGLCRLVRAELLGLRKRQFILAARSLGLHPLRILWRHLLPNALTPVLVQASLLIGDVILVESSLSFLGLGVQPPTASWGNMISDGRDVLVTAWWVSTFPGLAIVVAVLAFNLLGDRVRDLLDPRTATDG